MLKLLNKLSFSWTFDSPLFSRIVNRLLNTWVESQENWTPVQNGRLDEVEDRDWNNPLMLHALFFLQFCALKNREALNSQSCSTNNHFSFSLTNHSHLLFLFHTMTHCFVFAVLIMGFSESEARLGLRACQGDTTSAIDYITQKRQVNILRFLCQ